MFPLKRNKVVTYQKKGVFYRTKQAVIGLSLSPKLQLLGKLPRASFPGLCLHVHIFFLLFLRVFDFTSLRSFRHLLSFFHDSGYSDSGNVTYRNPFFVSYLLLLSLGAALRFQVFYCKSIVRTSSLICLHVLGLGCDGVFEWGESGAEGILPISPPLPERRALRLVPVSGIDRENLILLYSRNRNCFIDELMSILSFPAAKHRRRIFYIALRHWLEGSSKFLVRIKGDFNLPLSAPTLLVEYEGAKQDVRPKERSLQNDQVVKNPRPVKVGAGAVHNQRGAITYKERNEGQQRRESDIQITDRERKVAMRHEFDDRHNSYKAVRSSPSMTEAFESKSRKSKNFYIPWAWECIYWRYLNRAYTHASLSSAARQPAPGGSHCRCIVERTLRAGTRYCVWKMGPALLLSLRVLLHTVQ
ncbi:replication factor C small subunit [Striga asiatica]|uniref:Replication factor C small subunit n=1 Tax=Striga asiatica TaxID=4170 RepID=A0A5A7QWV1_STRAF|nr:replication factor C small subunit [Striga asiatica]